MEDYQIYNREEYISKKQLKNIYSASIVECIWKEIKAERDLYKYVLACDERSYYITLNTYFFHELLNVMDLTNKIKSYNQGIPKIVNEEEMSHFLQREQFFLHHKMYKFIMSNELLFLKIFVLWHFSVNCKIIAYLLEKNYMEEWLECIDGIERMVEEEQDDLDLTYSLQRFTQFFCLHLQNKMVTLLNSSVSDSQHRDVEYFLLRHPELSKKAIAFYVSHRDRNCYYTIEHYQTFSQASYENARQTLDKLVDLQWYKKHKIGKKFVYTIR